MSWKQLRFETLESRVVLDAAMFSIVGQASDAWVTINNYSFVGGSLSGGENQEGGWPVRAIADFTNDGVTDVLVKSAAGDWQLQVNDGIVLHVVPWSQSESAAGEVNANDHAPMPATAEMIDVADFDGNGIPDVALYDPSNGEVWIVVSTETHVEERIWATLPTTPNASSRFFVGDFDGDGLPDVLRGEDGARWILGRSDANQNQLTVSNWGNFPDYNWQHVVAGDFNGDEIDDIAALAPDSTWWVWSGSQGGFEAAQYAGHWKMREEWYDFGVADFNADGRDDVVGRSREGELFVGSSNEEGRFHTWRWGTGWVHQADWSAVTHVDFNEDGRVDQVGLAADGTWWYADNQGQSFRNRYITATQGFAVQEWLVLPHFSQTESVDVLAFQSLQKERLPDFFDNTDEPVEGEQPSDDPSNETPNSGSGVRIPRPSTVHRNNLVTVTLDDDNFIVLQGDEINLLGVDVISQGGHLTPVQGSAEPFDFFLANTPNQVTFGNLGRLELLADGRMWLPVQWDPSAGGEDLQVQWGGRLSSDDSGPRVQGIASLEAPLMAALAPQWADRTFKVSLDDQNHIVLNGSHALSGVEVKSKGGFLTRTSEFPDPFEFALVHSDSHVVMANLGLLQSVTSNKLVLPIQWDPAAGKLDLSVRWGANGREDFAVFDTELLELLD